MLRRKRRHTFNLNYYKVKPYWTKCQCFHWPPVFPTLLHAVGKVVWRVHVCMVRKRRDYRCPQNRDRNFRLQIFGPPRGFRLFPLTETLTLPGIEYGGGPSMPISTIICQGSLENQRVSLGDTPKASHQKDLMGCLATISAGPTLYGIGIWAYWTGWRCLSLVVF